MIQNPRTYDDHRLEPRVEEMKTIACIVLWMLRARTPIIWFVRMNEAETASSTALYPRALRSPNSGTRLENWKQWVSWTSFQNARGRAP